MRAVVGVSDTNGVSQLIGWRECAGDGAVTVRLYWAVAIINYIGEIGRASGELDRRGCGSARAGIAERKYNGISSVNDCATG